MERQLRSTGIDIIGDVPWGTHLCQFYQTKEDLLEILVPYFKKGLESNEYCMWVTSEPLRAQEAELAMRQAVPGFQQYAEKGQIDILPYSEWYTKGGHFDSERVLTGWVDRLNQALDRGYDGLRLTGNTFWLEEKDWLDFRDYEGKVNRVIGDYRMIAICTYSLDRCGASEVIDVVNNHQFALIRRETEWVLVESSERKWAEEETNIYMAGIDNAHEGIAFSNMNGDMLYFNESACQIFGYTSAEMKEKNISEFSATSADDKKLEDSVRKKGWFFGEIMGVRKNGETFPGTLSVTIVKDGSGKPIGRMGVFNDITEQKRAEEALEESERKYRTLFEEARDGIVLINRLSGAIVDCNPAYEKLSGRQLEDLQKMKIWEIRPPAKKPAARRSFFGKGGKGRGRSAEVEYQRPNGEIVPVEFSSREITLGNREYLLSISRDISDRKRMEAMLTEEKERLEVTLRSTGDGVITTDMKGSLVLLNRVAEELTGWTQKEAAGKPISEVFHMIDERKGRRIRNPVRKVLRTGRIIGLTNHVVLIARDGTERIIADSGAPIRDEQGNLFGVVMVFRDITQLRELEAERIKLDRLESLGVLAGGIAHDFNNFLGGILGNISMARRLSGLGGDITDLLQDSENACLRAKGLSQQLLTFARGGAPVRRFTSLGKLIRDSASLSASGSPIKCEYLIANDLWLVEADAGQIGQIIGNLVINAIEAMPDGGTIRIGAENAAIKRRISGIPLAKGKYVRMTVTDGGVGIHREHLDRIFDPYFTTKQKGSGLGLTTAFSIVNQHDGYIGVESAPGVGTTFDVYLPAALGASLGDGDSKTSAPVAGQAKILVMDDEESIRKMLSKTLALMGHEVELTKDGAEAIERYAAAMELAKSFDVVILDLTVPGGMGGKEAIKKLLEIDPDVKAIVSSGYSTDPIISDFRKYGFSGVAVKPYSVEELEETLEGLTAGKKRN
ncbi:PAS domain S-box protein [Chloroflexota bacterium]